MTATEHLALRHTVPVRAMAKSKEKVLTPVALPDTYGSDGVRYWARLGRPGMDAVFDETRMAIPYGKWRV